MTHKEEITPQKKTYQPLICIIISTKNEAENIERLLESIKKQDYPNYEIIIVDNHSTDKTLEIAQKHTDKIYTQGPERSPQRNFGASKAQGKYLLFLDADMEMPAELLSDCVNMCQQNSCGAMALPEENPASNFWAKCRNLEKQIAASETSLNAARFIKKEAFDQIGGYNETLISAEDYDLDDRLRYHNYKIGTSNLKVKHWSNEQIIEIVKKKYYYGKKLHRYISKNQRAAFRRFNPLRPVYLKKNKLLLKKPHMFAGLLLLKIIDYTSGGIGILVATARELSLRKSLP